MQEKRGMILWAPIIWHYRPAAGVFFNHNRADRVQRVIEKGDELIFYDLHAEPCCAVAQTATVTVLHHSGLSFRSRQFESRFEQNDIPGRDTVKLSQNLCLVLRILSYALICVDDIERIVGKGDPG